ncbi:hypothetical protein R1sor_015540 [Riccia sorocarpa]|uniref:C2H2-type domain-containing protein n=1 Tax=Riccia sorocarpa TaxID=122646 RepID=A0ABD3HGP8_9MARC
MAYIQLRDVFSALRGSSQSASKFTARVKVRIVEASGRVDGKFWYTACAFKVRERGADAERTCSRRLPLRDGTPSRGHICGSAGEILQWHFYIKVGDESVSGYELEDLPECLVFQAGQALMQCEPAAIVGLQAEEVSSLLCGWLRGSWVMMLEVIRSSSGPELKVVHAERLHIGMLMPRKGSRTDAGVVVPRPYYQKVDFDAWTYVRVYPTWDCDDRGWTREDCIKGHAQYYCTYPDCPMKNSRRGAVTSHLWTEHEIDAERQHIRKGGIKKWKAKSVPTPTLSKYEMMERANVMAWAHTDVGEIEPKTPVGADHNETEELPANVEAVNEHAVAEDDAAEEQMEPEEGGGGVQADDILNGNARHRYYRRLPPVIVVPPAPVRENFPVAPRHFVFVSDSESEDSAVEDESAVKKPVEVEDLPDEGQSSQAYGRRELPLRHRNPPVRFTPR